jgi:hypothetical protein
MRPSEIASALRRLQEAGVSRVDLSRLHHFSQGIAYGSSIRYFDGKESIGANNEAFGQRVVFVAAALSDRGDINAAIDEALVRWPLTRTVDAHVPVASREARAGVDKNARKLSADGRTAGRVLGDNGEAVVLRMLRERGYQADLLPTNFRTYDIQVLGRGIKFCVSVKTARNRQHLRLGSRASVDRLGEGNFVIALLPQGGTIDLDAQRFSLLVLPAAEVRDFALRLHDAYWAERPGRTQYSVMIKAYDARHANVWERWRANEGAWHLLPPP